MSSDRQVQITAGGVTIVATLNDSPTADALWEALPITARAQTWGDEIYFGVPVEAANDDYAEETVEMGAVGYWPPGSALCLFFGPTPMSAPGEIRPASAVNVLGVMEGDATVLKSVPGGASVTVERA
ncbi:MAG: cyclophilin-like fold protein [Chloroflexi bacterium]|nr:cyclophilin-like fold protein [Chloroflexota bacterium]